MNTFGAAASACLPREGAPIEVIRKYIEKPRKEVRQMQVKKHTAIVYRAYPNHEQRELIERTIGCARFVYNQMLADRIEHYKQTEELLRSTPAQYKDRFPFLREVDSMALCNAQLNLNRAYSRFFADPKHVGFPKFKAKHKAKSSYTTNCIKGNIRLEDSGRYLRLPKLGRVRVRQHKTIPADWKLKSVTVEHARSGKYTMTVLFEYESQIPEPHTPERFVGLDYSSHDLYVSSDGLTPDYPRFYRQAEQRLAREQRRLSHMQKQSNNWCKQKTKVARLHERVRNMRRDFLHKTANMLVEQYDCVCGGLEPASGQPIVGTRQKHDGQRVRIVAEHALLQAGTKRRAHGENRQVLPVQPTLP